MKLRLAYAMDPHKTHRVLDDETMARLARVCDVVASAPLHEFASVEARRVLGEVDVLVTGWGCPHISSEVLAEAPRLRLVAHAAGTVKSLIDPSAYERGITVTNAVDANAIPVAEFTLAAIIMANKRVLEFRDLYREDRTRRSSHALMDQPIGNYRRTIGIVGASRIGRRVIALLGNLDCDVLLTDPFVVASDPVAAGVELVDLDALMARSDVVSLHAPSLPATRGMIGARQLKLMRDGATFINTARGALVDEAALIAELRTGRISAVIDVTEPEIPPPDSPLFDLPNVLLTPHMAGAVGAERSRLGRLVADEVERFIAGAPLHYAVEARLLERLA
jgi:phosphoglycerate dehydrogenase-like enzyme